MTLGQQEISRHPLLATVLALQQAGHYGQASQVLADQDPYFYDQVEIKVLYGVLAHFPQPLIAQKPALCYVQALFARRMGQVQQATQLLLDAKATYAAANQHQGVVHCSLELARLAQQQGNAQRAHHYLQTEVQPLLEQQLRPAHRLQAHYALQMADSWLAQGNLAVAHTYAQQALTHYVDNGDAYGQLLAELWLARRALHAGEYRTARRHLSNAQQQMTAAPLGALAEAALRHNELLLAWYQRALETALQSAESYLSVADTEPYSRDRIEARLLLGNLHRDLRQYRAATSWYAETSAVIEQLGYPTYSARLQAELAWLHILEGQLPAARALLEDPRQRLQEGLGTNQRQVSQPQTLEVQQCQRLQTGLQVTQAMLHLLDGEWAQANALFDGTMAVYADRGDWLTVCTLRLYRGYSALHQGDTSTVLRQLEPAFHWLAAQQLTTFPHWWHPKILAEVCSHALLCNLYPEIVEQILVTHLGKTSLPSLKLLEKTDDIELRRQVFRLQQIIRGFSVSTLDQVRDSPNKQVIQELLEQGELCAETYHELESELMTAHNRQYPNPTIIAVFGLYIKGWSRAEIAKTLSCSLENVRNYITLIYQHFDLPATHFQSRESRKQKLIEVARARGFIY